MTVNPLLCPGDGFAIITSEGAKTREAAVHSNDISSILGHLSETGPGEVGHSLMCEAVSA
jgi:hypothetical protein